MNSKKATRDCFFFQSLTAPDSLKRLVHTLELIRSLKQLHEWIEHKKYYPVVCLTQNHVFRIFAGRLTDKHPVSIAPVLICDLLNFLFFNCHSLLHSFFFQTSVVSNFRQHYCNRRNNLKSKRSAA